MELNDDERQVLDLETQFPQTSPAKERAVRAASGRNLTRHYQRVMALLDRPEALVYAPMTVRRLQRLQESRRQVRSGRRAG